MDQEKIGKFIAEKRKEKNITQKEFALKLNVTDKTVSRWENGHYLPDVSLFKEICEILEIEVTELLNGEESKGKSKKEVEKTIMNIIDLSDKDKKKKVNKVLKISGVVICFLVLLSGIVLGFKQMKINKLRKEIILYQGETIDKTLAFPYRFAFKEMSDGWVCSFTMEYSYEDLDVPYYYGYNCENMKYPYMKGFNFNPYGLEDGKKIDRFYSYEPYSRPASYIYNEEYDKELVAIQEYFMDKKFIEKITIQDLSDLDLSLVRKDDVVEIFNLAISSEMVKERGNYDNLSSSSGIKFSETRKSSKWFGKERDYQYLLGYVSYDGYLYYVNIELLIDDEYLSDIVRSGKANKEQEALYELIEKHEKAIIEEQSFEEIYKDVSEEFAPICDIVTILEAEQKTDRYSND